MIWLSYNNEEGLHPRYGRISRWMMTWYLLMLPKFHTNVIATSQTTPINAWKCLITCIITSDITQVHHKWYQIHVINMRWQLVMSVPIYLLLHKRTWLQPRDVFLNLWKKIWQRFIFYNGFYMVSSIKKWTWAQVLLFFYNKVISFNLFRIKI